MYLIDLNGRAIKLTLSKQKRENCSKPHREIRELFSKLLPTFNIYEEVYVSGVYLDFFIPLLKTVIEVDGKQHDNYVEFFHKDGPGFLKSIQRDEKKEEFCRINELHLVRIPANMIDDKENLINEVLYGRRRYNPVD